MRRRTNALLLFTLFTAFALIQTITLPTHAQNPIRTIPIPLVQVAVAPAKQMTTPTVSASVAPARPVTPQIRAEVAGKPIQSTTSPAGKNTTPNTAPPQTYTIKTGDTLWDIAQAFNTTVDNLIAANNLTTSIIRPGQTLIIPAESPDTAEKTQTSLSASTARTTPPPTLGKFQLQYRTDPFTDEDTSFARLPAEESNYYRHPALYWRCNGSNEFELFISADDYLGSSPIRIRWRFDKNPASAETSWNDSTTGTAAFANTTQAKLFTRLALQAQKVIVGVKDYRDVESIFTFHLNGLNEALQRLECIQPEALNQPQPETPLDQPQETHVGSTIVFEDRSIGWLYQQIIPVITGLSYTEAINVIYLDGLTVRFSESKYSHKKKSILELEGTNSELYARIRAAVGRPLMREER